jgi:hypothetical protein
LLTSVYCLSCLCLISSTLLFFTFFLISLVFTIFLFPDSCGVGILDDVAIAEAIAQIEKELKGTKPAPVDTSSINSNNMNSNSTNPSERELAAPPVANEGPFSFVALLFIVISGIILGKFALKLF